MSTNVLHSAKACTWHTPLDIIEAARVVLGAIDLDPASSEEANIHVRAERYLTDALAPDVRWDFKDGPISVFCNPPGGKCTSGPMPRAFWKELMLFRSRQHLKDAIFVCYPLEQLQSFQVSGLSPLAFPLCVPSKRLRFRAPAGQKISSPTHANAIVYVPGLRNESQRFRDVFSQFGAVKL